MPVKYFARWNWEHDLPEDELHTVPEESASFAEVLLDDRGYPYRVIVHNPQTNVPLSVLRGEQQWLEVYDYFYDDSGECLEKRSLDDQGNVCLIVRRRKTPSGRWQEAAWGPDDDEPATIRVR